MNKNKAAEKILAAGFIVLFAALAVIVTIKILSIEGLPFRAGAAVAGVLASGTVLWYAYIAVVFSSYVIVRAARKVIRRKIK